MNISIDTKEAFDKNQTPFQDKNIKQTKDRGVLLNSIKEIYEKHTANIILNGERLIAFPLIL